MAASNSNHSRLFIFQEIVDERARQDAKFPKPIDYPDGTGGGGRETWRTIAQQSCDRAEREKRCTWAHILDEEVAEVLAETDEEKLRGELLQVASVACAWLEMIDARRRARKLATKPDPSA